MVTIAACYSFDWLKNVKINGKKISQGMMRMYEAIVRCTCGSDFSWVTPQGLARMTGLHQRTIERHIPAAIQAGLIIRGYSDEHHREGFFLLPHSELMAYAERFGKKLKKIVRAIAAIGSKAEEVTDNGTIENGNLSGDLSESLYREVNRELPTLSPRENEAENHEPCRAVNDEQREEYVIEDEEQTPPVVSTVLAEIGQEHEYIPLVALVKSSIIHVDGEKVQITAQKYNQKIIERHLPLLEDAFQRHGITQLSISAMSDEQQQQHDQRFLLRERQEKTKKQQNERLAAERAAETERQRIAVMTPEEQFGLLAALYPQPANGYRDMRPWDYRPAWNVFSDLHKTGKIPSVFSLLQNVKKQKLSTDWSRDNGRWIPGLWKWLSVFV